jgi:AraC-like DNA-binding protein
MAKAKKRAIIQNPRLGVMPEGILLDYVADVSGDFGFAYERFLNFQKDSHSHERFVFCAARGASLFKVTELKTGKRFVNSKDTSVFKAPHSLHSLKSDQTIYENLVFLPTAQRIRAVFNERGYKDGQWAILNSGIREVNRTPWFNALVERYFHQRVFGSSSRQAYKFLEDEIIREILIMALGEPGAKGVRPARQVSDTISDSIRRVVELLELSLFSKMQLDDIAKNAGMSRASLMRAFQRELQQSPMAYVRGRRLEEAQRLIEKGKHTITEISYLVGYEDTSAFCRAYKALYRVSPRESGQKFAP